MEESLNWAASYSKKGVYISASDGHSGFRNPAPRRTFVNVRQPPNYTPAAYLLKHEQPKTLEGYLGEFEVPQYSPRANYY